MSPVATLVTVGLAAPAPAEPEVAAAVAAAGLPLVSRSQVEDDEAALERALGPDDSLTVILAGAGGAAGDIVRRVLARVAGVRLVLSERMLAALEERHRRQDRPLPRRAERLALLPQGATPWVTVGASPGWLLESGARAFVVLPGESARALVEEHLIPYASTRLGQRAAGATRTLRVVGVTVGEVEERLAEGPGREGDVTATPLPADGEVWVRLRARGATRAAAAQALARVEERVAAALGEDCFGRDAESLEVVVGRLLLARRLTLAVAESCTGGLLGHRVTSVPGASAYFERGVLVYSNRAKEELLGVSAEILRAHGAVSDACAQAMARGVAARAGTACGLGITGVAGPDGGTPAKPVGTVFVGLAVGDAVGARRFHFEGDRASIKWQSTQMALDMLRRALLKETR
jgi:nicotinamide-nucleotide amidase